MKKFLAVLAFVSLIPFAKAQTNQTTLDQLFKVIGTPTNYAVEPYITYAPQAKTKIGAGVMAAYNFNQWVGAGIGLDWLGKFSLVSGNITLQAPFHPLPNVLPSMVVSPFILGGIATASSGAGKFNGAASSVADVGDYIKFGHLWGGSFNTGLAYGKWSNVGPDYGGMRWHVFAGWSKGF